MDLQNLLQKVFPAGQCGGRSYGFEVNGLPKNTQPQNCDILVQGQEPDSRGDRREHFLVRVDGVLLFFRICTAMEGSGYDEFVAGHKPAILAEDQQELERYARDWIASMCKPR